MSVCRGEPSPQIGSVRVRDIVAYRRITDKSMKKHLFLSCMIMLVLSCGSSASSRVPVDEQDINRIPQNSSLPDEQDSYFISKPQDGSLIITGVSNR